MSKLDSKTTRKAWVKLCRVDDIPPRGGRNIQFGEIELAVFQLTHGAIVVVEDRCPHKGGKLSEGIISDHAVTCPLHNWRIDLLRGEAIEPDKGCVRKFPVDIREDSVFINMGDKAEIPKPLGDAVGRHPDTGRPKLGRRRAKKEDFSIYDFDGPIPILAVEPPSPETEESYQLTISTEGGDVLSYSLEELRKEFTVQEVPAHITCLMFNFAKPVTWTAIRLADILAKCEGEFNFASFYSWDTHETKEGDRFFETLPKNYVLDPRTLLSIGMNGGPLPKEHGGPLRLAAPFLQGYKSVKWLTDIRLTTEDEVGYKKLHGFIEFPEFNPPPSA